MYFRYVPFKVGLVRQSSHTTPALQTGISISKLALIEQSVQNNAVWHQHCSGTKQGWCQTLGAALFCTRIKPWAWTDLHVGNHIFSNNGAWLASHSCCFRYPCHSWCVNNTYSSDEGAAKLKFSPYLQNVSIINTRPYHKVPTRFIKQCKIGLRWIWYLTIIIP